MVIALGHKVDVLIQLLILVGHLYLSGMWLDVALRTKIPKRYVFKEIGLHVQNMITILGSITTIIGRT